MAEYYQNSWEQASQRHVEAYVAYLHNTKKLAPTTIRSKLSGIAYFAQGSLKNNITKSFVVDKLLKKYTKEAPPSGSETSTNPETFAKAITRICQ